MRQPSHVKAKLPRKLLEELGIADNHGGSGGRRNGPDRKERRKTARVQKKARTLPSRTKTLIPGLAQPKSSREKEASIIEEPRPSKSHEHAKTRTETGNTPKLILKKPKAETVAKAVSRKRDSNLPSPSLPNKSLSRGEKDRLDADDAEIAALEKSLGLKGRATLPKAFADDGLDTLLNDLGGSPSNNESLVAKRKRAEEDEWLQRKRRKAQVAQIKIRKALDEGFSTEEDEDLRGDESTDDGLSHSGDDEADAFSISSEKSSSLEPPKRTARENPYRAPQVISNGDTSSKYRPPSLRDACPPLAEDLTPLRRQLQGLLNRLSEANLLSILRDVEKQYQNNARQHVSTTLIDLLMGLLCDPTSLQDTFIILHAGFIAAIYKMIGTEFGAQVIQRVHEEFVENYPLESNIDSRTKRTANLINLLAELYNFQVIGSNLIYDFIRIFLDDLSETSTELVMKIMRNSGPQLRQDDASSLKDIVLLLSSAVAKKGEGNLSVRAKFMIEIINNLKNNRMKTGITASTIASEHTIRMKRTLGSLNTRTVKAGEPLRIGLKDLQESDKRGKWWLIGASYKDEGRDEMEDVAMEKKYRTDEISNEQSISESVSTDLLQLAREQRMNTDVRRSIFVAIMSATDYKDAHLRLQKLRLKKAQELEIPKVLIHCAAAEKTYNPFYSLVARRVCSDRKLKMAFQFSLWDLFKRMGEGQDGDEGDPSDESEATLGMRSLVSLAKLFGVLIAEGGIKITVLKTLNLAYLAPQTATFTELLLISTILHSQPPTPLPSSSAAAAAAHPPRDEKALAQIFRPCNEFPVLARALRYFLRKVVSRTDVAGGRREHETVVWGCRVAGGVLGEGYAEGGG